MNQSKNFHIKENLSVCDFEGIGDRPGFEGHGFEAHPHPNILVSAADYCGVILDFDQLKEMYLKIPTQPPFPWLDDILKDSLNIVNL